MSYVEKDGWMSLFVIKKKNITVIEWQLVE